MFIALYRWKLREGREADFCAGWRRVTAEIYRRFGSNGSRLHKAEDGTWVAYAQWPDRQTWARARDAAVEDVEAQSMMRESIEARYPHVCMEVVDDLLRAERFAGDVQQSEP